MDDTLLSIMRVFPGRGQYQRASQSPSEIDLRNLAAMNPNANARNNNRQGTETEAGAPRERYIDLRDSDNNNDMMATESGSDSDEDTAAQRAMLDVFNAKSNLPNSVHVMQIIKHMQNFALQSQLPPNLNYKPTEDDKRLEENIKKLFGDVDPLWEADTLEQIMSRIVEREDNLMHPKEVKEFRRHNMKKIEKSDKNVLKLFYPNLVRLIMALIAHIHNNTAQLLLQKGAGGSNAMASSSDAKTWQTNSVILSLWKQVLTEMNELHSIIIYANGIDVPFLGEYDTKWEKLIENRNKEINTLNQSMHLVIDRINELEKFINERDKQIEKIRAQYANKVDELELANSQRQGVQERLAQLLDVKVMVGNNLTQLIKSFPQYEKEIVRNSSSSR